MPDHAVEILIANAIHTAFIKYPEGDGRERSHDGRHIGMGFNRYAGPISCGATDGAAHR
jgi:hypothetical protein